ncbi:unnamed protein product [Acanthoscelides obtectus]|uniref:Nuclear pore complex protein Nup133 n=1 Tax=Acanthoscelides obtectus TaxID=200917 RepID=A0A9P0PFR8_ACAOB|nr:unnamed protein product [Acanthoscelides obtectus]CAK1647371.1 Nuclear pore complex protein Nup133 [Acanthoscelides obtectus]
MDRSFQSSFSTKSPYSPRSRQSISSSSKRILPSSFRKSSRLKSSQSVQIILRSAQNYVERFGQSLPVLITEALTFADRNQLVSARISESGYVWIVCGRRLLIWQYKQVATQSSTPQTPQRKHASLNQCYELQLPQSDLAHKAELVSVFQTNIHSTPSCIAVSPEGVVRYWSAVAHETSYVEQSVELQGQECDSLTDASADIGCVLATTTCTVAIIRPYQDSGGACRPKLHCRPLTKPAGWLGGIGKRMSSLIFGPLSGGEHAAETRLVRVLTAPSIDGAYTVYVLAGHSIQKWQIKHREQDQLAWACDVARSVRDRFRAAVWPGCGGDQAEIDTWLLDIRPDKDGIIVLAGAVNMHASPQVHYALISFATEENADIRDFFLLKITGLYREEHSSESLSYRFLLSGNTAYLYNLKSVIVIRPQEDPDTVEFNASQDYLLGGSICGGTPVFFSKLHGLVLICSNSSAIGDQTTDFLNQSGVMTPVESSFVNETLSTAANNLSIYNLNPEEVYNAYKDTVGQLKAAFIFHIKGQKREYQEIVSELFPPDMHDVPNIDSTLDKITIEMTTDILNDIPVSDPRWTKDSPSNPGIGSSYSMQVMLQLEDKQKAFWFFVRFLKDSGLWNRLSAVAIRGTVMATTSIIGELAEKITAAIVLKSLPNSLILENAVEKAIKYFDSEPKNGLTNQDVFYREVGKMHRGIQELANCCEETAHSDLSPGQVAQVVHDTNEIILTVMNEVIQYRNQNADHFAPSDIVKSLNNLEYQPWTSAPGEEGLADALLLQHNLTYNYGLKLIGHGSLRTSLLDHFIAITDVMLDGRKTHLESLHQKDTSRERALYKLYASDRHKLIQPLLQEKEWEKAALLAEKYLDFETLVIICETNDNQKRLDEYIQRFDNDGFSEYVYNWFLKQNKQGRLIDWYRRSGKTKYLDKLTSFLKDHPSISWIQLVFDHKFAAASETLLHLANEETESVTRQKTMLSISKLASLAAPPVADIEEKIDTINHKLELVTLREEVPDYVLQQYGYDTVTPRVIPPKDLIHLYTCSEYSDATELEFKKAIDILPFVEDPELREEMQLKIWRTAILRDNWNYQNLDAPLEVLQRTLFFRIVELSLVLGANPQDILPPLDVLIEAESMKTLQDNNSFQFLIKTAYEYVYRTQVL